MRTPKSPCQTTAKLDVVLRERAHLAAAVATVERDALVRDVNVRQRQQVRQVAIARVVVIEIFLRPKGHGIDADLESVPSGDTREVGLGPDRLDFTQ